MINSILVKQLVLKRLYQFRNSILILFIDDTLRLRISKNIFYTYLLGNYKRQNNLKTFLFTFLGLMLLII